MATAGSATMSLDVARGQAMLEATFLWADEHGVDEVAARVLNIVGVRLWQVDRHDEAAVAFDRAITFCIDRTSDLWRINALACAARNGLDRGAWTDAAHYAAAVLEDPRDSPWPHHEALLVLALVRARRGDPGADDAIAAAIAVDVPLDEEEAHIDLAAARAEVAWCERRSDVVDAVTAAAIADARRRERADAVGRHAFWRRLSGFDVQDVVSTTPFGLAAAGRWREASDEFDHRGRPYEAALSLVEVGDELSLRAALVELRGSARCRRRRWRCSACGRSACGAWSAGRGERRSSTRPG